jgi:hypothetical protein
VTALEATKEKESKMLRGNDNSNSFSAAAPKKK